MKKLLVVTVYAAIAFAGLVAAAPALSQGWLALVRPCVYLPGLRAPAFWILGAALTMIALYHVVRSTFVPLAHRRLGAGVMLLAASLLVVGRLLADRAGPAPGPAPVARLDLALHRARTLLAEAQRRADRYPVRFPGGAVLRDAAGQPLDTGYLGHGRPLAFRVADRGVSPGPALTARARDLPGTVYYTVAADGGRYWLTALMMDGAPVGPARFVRDAEHRVVVVTPDTPERNPE